MKDSEGHQKPSVMLCKRLTADLYHSRETHRADTEGRHDMLIQLESAENVFFFLSFQQTRKAFSVCDNGCRVNMSVTDGLCACFVILMNF